MDCCHPTDEVLADRSDGDILPRESLAEKSPIAAHSLTRLRSYPHEAFAASAISLQPLALVTLAWPNTHINLHRWMLTAQGASSNASASESSVSQPAVLFSTRTSHGPGMLVDR